METNMQIYIFVCLTILANADQNHFKRCKAWTTTVAAYICRCSPLKYSTNT